MPGACICFLSSDVIYGERHELKNKWFFMELTCNEYAKPVRVSGTCIVSMLRVHCCWFFLHIIPVISRFPILSFD